MTYDPTAMIATILAGFDARITAAEGGISPGQPGNGPVFTVQPVISPSTGAAGTTFTATPGVATAPIVSRAWLLNGTSISTGLTAVPMAGGVLTYQEAATDAEGVTTVSQVQTVTVSAAIPAPVFTVQPSISPASGVAGATFTATDGSASNATGYTRRWLLGGTSIGTGSTVVPVTAGALSLEVTATGPGGSTIATSAAVTVSAATPSLTISGNPGAATVGTSPTFTPAISGGTAPYTLSLANGTLPPGRAVNGSAKTVTGTYTTAGSYSYTLRATDAAGATADLSINVTVAAAVAGYDLILLAGQSNMVGRSGPISATLDATDDRIMQYGFDSQTITLASDPLDSQDEGADTISMGLSLAKAYIADGKLAPNRKVLLVPVAKGDTGFTGGFWVAGGEGDVAAIARANAAMDQPGSNKWVMVAWHQGERDRFSNRLTYSSNVDALIARWRSSITGASAVPFILGGMVAGGAQTAGDISVAIEDTPNRVALTAFVSSSGLSAGSDNVHFIASSLRTFGGRYYAANASALANNAAPAAPAKVTGLVASAASGQAGLTWNLPSANRSPITDYIVEFKPSSGTTWTVFADGTSANTSATVTGLTNGTAYDFRVSAVNGIGTGAVSDPANATPVAPPSTGLLATYTAPDGTNLTAYTTDSGHTYARTAGTMSIIGGRATATEVGADGVYSWDPQSIFQRIRARMIVNTKNGSHYIRYRHVDVNNHFYFGLGSGGTAHYLSSTINGTATGITGGGTTTTPTVNVGDTLDYELTITGTVGDETHTLRLSQNGGAQVVVFTGKPTAAQMQTLANPGRIAHREFSSSSSATTGVQIDNLDAVAL